MALAGVQDLFTDRLETFDGLKHPWLLFAQAICDHAMVLTRAFAGGPLV